MLPLISETTPFTMIDTGRYHSEFKHRNLQGQRLHIKIYSIKPFSPKTEKYVKKINING